MFDNVLAKLKLFGEMPANDFIEQRRKELRREGMQAEVIIGRRAYPVFDWSRSGVSFETPDRDWNLGRVHYESPYAPRLREGEAVRMTLRFYALQGEVDIPVDATILRVSGNRTVAQFGELPAAANRLFETVIDSLNAQNFMESQIAGTRQNGDWQ